MTDTFSYIFSRFPTPSAPGRLDLNDNIKKQFRHPFIILSIVNYRYFHKTVYSKQSGR
jgi:hypothetical protein